MPVIGNDGGGDRWRDYRGQIQKWLDVQSGLPPSRPKAAKKTHNQGRPKPRRHNADEAKGITPDASEQETGYGIGVVVVHSHSFIHALASCTAAWAAISWAAGFG